MRRSRPSVARTPEPRGEALSFRHQTVLLREAVALLEPREDRLMVDGTLGGGGHAEALLEAGAELIGIDRDPRAVAAAAARLARFGGRFRGVQGAFGDVAAILRRLGVGPVDGLLLDLGVSSPQLDEPARGFSFQHDGPLDMRMADTGETAADLIDRLDEGALADVLYGFGEERASRAVARALKVRRPRTTAEAVEAVKAAIPRRRWPKEHHVATRTFQALRIAVNGELVQLEAALAALPEVLADGGVAAVISFHSLEDRLVKRAFRRLAGEGDGDDASLPRGLPPPSATAAAPSDFELCGRRAVSATDEELRENPRARSAHLRGLRRVRGAPRGRAAATLQRGASA